MGRQRNHPQTKEKEGSPEKELNEIEARNLSDIEFKIVVMKMFKKLSEKYKDLHGNYMELSGNCSSMKKDTETMKGPERNEKYNI